MIPRSRRWCPTRRRRCDHGDVVVRRYCQQPRDGFKATQRVGVGGGNGEEREEVEEEDEGECTHCWRRESAGADRAAPAGQEFSSQFLCTTLARSRLLSLLLSPPCLAPFLYLPSPSFRFFPFPDLLSADPLFIRLSFVVPYGAALPTHQW